MASIVSEFFQIIGAGPVPETLGELIPYLLQVGVGIFLVSGVFGVIGMLGESLLGCFRR